MKRAIRLLWLGFLCIFGTTKHLENVEEDWAFITGTDKKNSKPEPRKPSTSEKSPARNGHDATEPET